MAMGMGMGMGVGVGVGVAARETRPTTEGYSAFMVDLRLMPYAEAPVRTAPSNA
jgi:hypothetical protein